jgi:hypothetical protein
MKEQKVLSLPVVDTNTNVVIGVVDILDICTYIVGINIIFSQMR